MLAQLKNKVLDCRGGELEGEELATQKFLLELLAEKSDKGDGGWGI